MSRTVKTEWSKPDSWHLNLRMERKARPAGRIQIIVNGELRDAGWFPEPSESAGPIVFEPAGDDIMSWEVEECENRCICPACENDEPDNCWVASHFDMNGEFN